MSTDPLLAVEAVDSGYGETQVLWGLSLDVYRGEIVSLVGRNGAGKTTTFRTIMGMLTPTAGTISFDGSDITALDAAETARRGVSMVPEERRIFPKLTVRENLRLADIGGSDEHEGFSIEEAFDLFGRLDERQSNTGESLSGGEQQMLAIARGLVAGAELLLLDEPTEGLAPFIVEDVVDVIEQLNEGGITVLLAEQNVHIGLSVADRNYVIADGEVVFEGTSAQLEDDQETMDRHLGVTG